jgi:hypothetical protein
MSVVLLVSPKAGAVLVDDSSRTIPIATQETFRSYWKQGGQALGLRWVPMFETGTPVQPDDIPDVVLELRKLADWARRSNVPNPVVSRMDELIAALLKVQGSQDVDVFIG